MRGHVNSSTNTVHGGMQSSGIYITDISQQKNTILITMSNGKQYEFTIDIKAPIKGIDYFTNADKKDLINSFINSKYFHDLEDSIVTKQEKIIFNSIYNAENNKAATMNDLVEIEQSLNNTLHFIGFFPSLGVLLSQEDYIPKVGDTVLTEGGMHLFDGEVWIKVTAASDTPSTGMSEMHWGVLGE